ncbi:MAG: alpha-glucan family phosphorylase [Acidimicrobiales bacterium]
MDTSGLRESLLALARNHYWSWSLHARALFAAVPGFGPDIHPVQLVGGLDEAQLTELLADDSFVESLRAESETLAVLAAETVTEPTVAYFSPEFGISERVPQYSGGLGILAGDHLKASSDLTVSLCGVGLFYRRGFFRQRIENRRQVEHYDRYDPSDFGCLDTGLVVSIPFPGRKVLARVWRHDVGRVPLLLLDTEMGANQQQDRQITDRLYSGDRRHRLEQELILGVGGSRALHEMGWPAPIRHLNEGHAAFLILDLLDAQIASGRSLSEAVEAVRPRIVFTTHTPVPAGIDRFETDLAASYLEPWSVRWGVPLPELLALGTDPSDRPEAFNMAAFALRIAGRANGVSQLHGAVSRQLFASVPGGDAIGSITNGVHARTWVMPRLQTMFDETLGDGWTSGDTESWHRVDQIPNDTIRSLRRSGGEDLRAMVAERTGATVDPDVLTVGFARRFATYKRATLLLEHADRLIDLLGSTDRPVQFVFAGKAHPADGEGKALLNAIVEFGASEESNGRFVFVPDYDIAVAEAMYAGCDVWLNNPVRPHEASGTSGEKSALNGGLNLSISDGWWDEMADGENGWTIPASDGSSSDHVRDRAESAAALDLLAERVIPEFYEDGSAWSNRWIERIRHTWRTLGPEVTAGRMVAAYEAELYRPALAAVDGR